jgi:glutamine synthetase
LKNSKKAMKIAEDLNTEKMVKRNRNYKVLPLSCNESAKNLKRDRKYYEADGVFPKRVIEGIIRKLESYKDRDLTKLASKPEKIEELLLEYLHYG